MDLARASYVSRGADDTVEFDLDQMTRCFTREINRNPRDEEETDPDRIRVQNFEEARRKKLGLRGRALVRPPWDPEVYSIDGKPPTGIKQHWDNTGTACCLFARVNSHFSLRLLHL